jgi:hypothetical protein
MMTHTYNPTILKARQEDHEFKVILCYLERPYLQTNKTLKEKSLLLPMMFASVSDFYFFMWIQVNIPHPFVSA